jgi:hypothetical protein
MDEFLYFAYGSNLLRERLLPRCPNLVLEGRALLAEHGLVFDKVSSDTSGKCAFVSAAHAAVHGTLWRLLQDDLMELDRHEGVGVGYERCVMPVMREDGCTELAVTYRATRLETGLLPFDWYLALVIAGASQQGLPEDYVAQLRASPFRVDSDIRRKARLEAIDALTNAGMMDVLRELQRRNSFDLTGG